MTLQFSLKGLWIGAIQVAFVFLLITAVPLLFGSLPKYYLSLIWLSSWALSLIFLNQDERFSILTSLLINSMAVIVLLVSIPSKGIILMVASLLISPLHLAITKSNNSMILNIAGPSIVFFLIHLVETTL